MFPLEFKLGEKSYTIKSEKDLIWIMIIHKGTLYYARAIDDDEDLPRDCKELAKYYVWEKRGVRTYPTSFCPGCGMYNPVTERLASVSYAVAYKCVLDTEEEVGVEYTLMLYSTEPFVEYGYIYLGTIPEEDGSVRIDDARVRKRHSIPFPRELWRELGFEEDYAVENKDLFDKIFEEFQKENKESIERLLRHYKIRY